MQLGRLTSLAALALAFALALPGLGADAQSLSPMRKDGRTPTETKGFRLVVGNPYPTRMTFQLVPMQPGFEVPAEDATVRPNRITLAPGFSRPVILTFKISPEEKERTVAVCIIPEGIEGPVLPRVCGTYVGRLLSAR